MILASGAWLRKTRMPARRTLFVIACSFCTSLTPPLPPLISKDSPRFRVHRVVEKLELNGIQSTKKEYYQETTKDVIQVLKSLKSSPSFLNKRNLLHEVEESIVALHHLKAANIQKDFVAVDICCGKGTFSLLLAYLAGGLWKNQLRNLQKIVLLEKEASKIDWTHIEIANKNHASQGRPFLDLWKGTNLFDDTVFDRLCQLNVPIALSGIHLCRTLGPTAIGLFNQLEPIACYLCLAPCCLPRQALPKNFPTANAQQSQISIAAFEPPMQRNARLRLLKARRQTVCFVCQEDHHVKDCPEQHSHSDRQEWEDRVDAAVVAGLCQNCGQEGHPAKQCPNARVNPLQVPTLLMDTAESAQSPAPFENYCDLLSKFLQNCESVKVIESGLLGKGHQQQDCYSSWNAKRKSIFIIGQRKEKYA